MSKKYAIGIDFGTLSARATLIDVADGSEVCVAVYGYQDAVIDTYLPETHEKLPPDFALQNPNDYTEALIALLKEIPQKAKIAPEEIIGIGVVFTACTVVALDEHMRPLCENPEFRANPHSWVKLWKHHGAQPQADRINALALERGEDFIHRYGDKSSSEWLFAKILETLEGAPEIYENTALFLEAGDWMVYMLTGNLRKSSCLASYKAFWSPETGYPSDDFLCALDPRLEGLVEKKLGGNEVWPIGTCAGELTQEIANLTGLPRSVRVGVANIDAHVSAPALGMSSDATMMMIMGTSLCHMLISKECVPMSGLCGVAKDGILPGYYGYEFGQSAVGDIYDWFVTHLANYQSIQEIQRLDANLFDYMDQKMNEIRPGTSGLLALDWWNGSRSVLMDAELSGMLIGMTLSTKPEEIYRALVEATAFGSRKILQTLESNGVSVRSIIACGGLARKSPEIMQIFADVLGREIHVADTAQACALGGAMYGAVAAGKEHGGYDTIYEASRGMAVKCLRTYTPNRAYRRTYDDLYVQYELLHDLFGRGGCSTMKELKRIRSAALAKT